MRPSMHDLFDGSDMGLIPEFEYIENAAGGPLWLHKSAPVWVRHYEAIPGIQEPFYQAYKAVARVPAGRMPWTVGNRRVGNSDRGFPSLSAAMAAAELEIEAANG